MSFKLICGGLASKFQALNLKNVVLPAVNLHTTAIASGKINRMKDRTSMLRTVVKKGDGAVGEKSVDLDNLIKSQQFQRFPDEHLPERLYGETAFKDLPIIYIRVSKNNTIVNLTDGSGKPLALNSCGKEGYKNCRKGTNIAGQATAITLGKESLAKGIHTVRVVIRGLGPGRASSITGLHMAGLNIVSITDATRVSDNPPRARKARRI